MKNDDVKNSPKILREVDVNADVGEIGFERDAQLLPWVTSCNVSCGAHAGNEASILRTLEMACEQGVSLGAHPSYPDRKNFGRKAMDMSPESLTVSVAEQIAWLITKARSVGGKVSHVKPHGALYHAFCRCDITANAFLEGVRQSAVQVSIIGMSGADVAAHCGDEGWTFLHEVFSDRRYANPTELLKRAEPGAVMSSVDDINRQVDGFCDGVVVDISGARHVRQIDTICVHGDAPDAIAVAQHVVSRLSANGVVVRPPQPRE